jgi:hypothetical protein
MFYLAVIILLINMTVSFTAGLYQGIKFSTGGMEALTSSKIAMVIGIGLAVLIPLIVVTFLILRWGFNKLYGCYLISLNDTLKELDESE